MEIKFGDTKLEPEELKDGIALMQALHDIQLFLAYQASPIFDAKYGVDIHLYHVLKRIAAGNVFPGELARATFSQPSKISRQLDKLVSLGLIERVLDKDDTRKVRIELTAKAADAISNMDAEYAVLLRPALSKFGTSERTALLANLTQVFGSLKAEYCLPEQR